MFVVLIRSSPIPSVLHKQRANNYPDSIDQGMLENEINAS